MINSRKIEDLLPPVAARADAFVAACQAAGIDVIITSTLRDNEAQAVLYAQGRTTNGPIATRALPGKSWHNHGCAFDFVPVVNGKAQWQDASTFQRCGVIAESVGLEWAGRWTGKIRERAHCQYTGGLTIADVLAGNRVV